MVLFSMNLFKQHLPSHYSCSFSTSCTASYYLASSQFLLVDSLLCIYLHSACCLQGLWAQGSMSWLFNTCMPLTILWTKANTCPSSVWYGIIFTNVIFYLPYSYPCLMEAWRHESNGVTEVGGGNMLGATVTFGAIPCLSQFGHGPIFEDPWLLLATPAPNFWVRIKH